MILLTLKLMMLMKMTMMDDGDNAADDDDDDDVDDDDGDDDGDDDDGDDDLREFALCKLTLSPRVWMGCRIPTRWLWYGRDDQDDRDGRDGRRVSKSAVLVRVFYRRNDHFSVLPQRNTSKLSVLRPFEGRLFTL